MGETTLNITICPNCGHEQAHTNECVKCGVIISKFEEIRKRPKSDQRDRFKKLTESKTENLSHRIIKRTIWTVIFLFVGSVAAFIYLGNRMTDMHMVHSATQSYCDSFARKFPDVCKEEGMCCYDCLSAIMQSGDYTRRDLEELFQDIIPRDEIRDLGFLVAKSIKISKDAEIPILVCKTAIEPLRPKYGGPPGKDHLVVYPGFASSWMIPLDYAALDKSQYVDIKVLIKEYDEVTRKID